MSKHHSIANGITVRSYELRFEPDLRTFRFKGEAVISMHVGKASRSLRLHSKELEIKRVIVSRGKVRQEAAIRHDGEEMVLSLRKSVKGEVKLTIDYEGIHNDRLYGFYRSSYVRRGRKEYLLSTQFETTNARAAFPCIDEPEAKATFRVSMLIDRDLQALSNMPVKNTKKIGTKKLVLFHTTPRMSTYLLYLGVGRYDLLKSRTRGTAVSVITRKGNGAYARLPMEYGKAFFADLQRYFKVRYPLPKLDLIGIPDFAAGAMENWGAIAFRETALLGKKDTSLSGRQRIAVVIAHELVHQWFGDLVTMRWWDDMWLNESFATFIAYKSVDRIFPEWKMMLGYRLDNVGPALVADGMKNTHPVSVDVRTAGEIEALFDAIGYGKGGSVLLMLEDFVRPEIFRKGLTRYLKKNAYSNATKKDLWSAIEAECKVHGNRQPVVGIMEDWINKEGYPIVSVRRKGDGFELSQERFTISGRMPGRWRIPIRYISENGEGQVLMDRKRVVIKDAGRWIKLNHRQSGFYRVEYSPDDLVVLGRMVREKKLDGMDVWGMENDLFMLIRSGMEPLERYAVFIGDFCMDAGYPADESISGHLQWLTTITDGKAEGIRRLSLAFHRRILAEVGWEAKAGESSTETKLRSAAIAELGRLGDPGVVKRVKGLFSDFERGKPVNPDLKAVILAVAAYNSPSRKKFGLFVRMYKGSGTPEEKIMALRAMGMLNEKKLLLKALDYNMSGHIRLQDSLTIPLTMAGLNPLGGSLYKRWAMKNWARLIRRYSASSHMLRACVSGFGALADRKSKSELEAFFKDPSNMRDDIRLAVKQALERISANIRFMERNSL